MTTLTFVAVEKSLLASPLLRSVITVSSRSEFITIVVGLEDSVLQFGELSLFFHFFLKSLNGSFCLQFRDVSDLFWLTLFAFGCFEQSSGVRGLYFKLYCYMKC